MKKTFLILFGCVVLVSCSHETEILNESFNEQKELQNLVETNDNQNVTLTDIQAYMEKGSAIASRNGGDGEIEIVTYQNDTVMYLLKYCNGWEMMPGDKRFPLRVAYNDEGTLDYANMHEAQRAWFDNMAEEIHVMKKYGKGIENEYCKVWSTFSKNSKKKNSPRTRSGNGEWMYHNTREVVNVEEKNHLISTHWGQWSSRMLRGLPDYNMYCPLNSTGTNKSPAGCAAVAGAQVLYYFHKLWGVPNKMVTSASYINNEYIFNGWDSSKWTEIARGDLDVDNGMEAIALLIGDVGFRSDMNYQDSISETSLSKLTNALNDYGIGSSGMNSWDVEIIRNNIKSNKPIIVGITGTVSNGKETGHILIIDGYKHVTTTYTDVYIYISDPNSYHGDMYDHDESGNPVPEEGPTMEETYATIQTYYQVNWGYEDEDNAYYLSYNPLYYDYGGNMGTVVYNRNKAMLYNFYVK